MLEPHTTAEHHARVGFQGPTSGGAAKSLSDCLGIVCHPAFRLGFLDACAGKPVNHDKIADRIVAETPPNALKRLGYKHDDLFERKEIELAQYRYEEGRLLFFIEGLKVKAWGHPDFPPRAVWDYLHKRCADELRERAEKIRQELDAQLGTQSIVDLMRVRR